MKREFAFVALLLVSGVIAAAQAFNPVVNMTVSLPNGEMKHVSAPESGLAIVTLADGTEFGFRPTIVDCKPWNRVTATVFKMATGNQETQVLGEIEVRVGGAPVESGTIPAFKIAVTNVGLATPCPMCSQHTSE